MPPPSEEEIEQYRIDGTLEERIQNAIELGGHRMDPRLIFNADRTLRRKLGLPFSTAKPPPRWQGMPTSGTVDIVVLCVAFADFPPTTSISSIEDQLFGEGNPENHPYESLRSYYQRSSYNTLDIQGNVLGWYTTEYTRDLVVSERALIKELFMHYDAEHDFSQYDNDGDGVIDYFAIIWTGNHTGWSSQWWAHRTHFYNNSFYVDGKMLDVYSWNWESQYSEGGTPGDFSPRVIIHETGHAVGLPDYYDYDKSVGPVGGVGDLDMMDANWGDHNAFSKFVLDWIDPDVYTEGTHDITLRASDSYPDGAIVMPEAQAGGQFGEYFIIQNRNRENNDADHPGKGLLIWHVNAQLDSSGDDYEYDNSFADLKLLRLMEADGLEEIETTLVPYGGRADAGDYYTQGQQFGPDSTPDNNRYDGTDSGFLVSNISAAGATMSFTVTYDTSPPSDIALVNDGTGQDIDTATSGTTLSANWPAASDTESGIARYLYAIGASPGATDTAGWTSNGLLTTVTRDDLALASGTTYYFSVKAENGARLSSGVTTSDGVTVTFSDATPPSAPDYVYDCGSASCYGDSDYTASTSGLDARWEASQDNESGIAAYWYSAGTTSGASDVVEWTCNSAGTEAGITGLALVHGQEYFISVKAENGAGLMSGTTTSDGQLVDTTPPGQIVTVNDGPDADIDTTTWLNRLEANWSVTSDPESGVVSYYYAIGKSPGATDVVGWIDAGTATSAEKQDLTLIDMQVYYFSVKAENAAGLASDPATSDGQVFELDTSPPDPVSFVYDGTAGDIDTAESNRRLDANWGAASDPESGVIKYWYAVGTSAGATDTLFWTSAGTATSATFETTEKLGDGQVYYFTVKAENGASLKSDPVSSDGQIIDVFDVDSVLQVDSTTIDVVFSRDVSASTSATDTASYSVNYGIGTPASAVLQPDGLTVRLTVAEMGECIPYELGMTGISSADTDGKELVAEASPAEIELGGTLVRDAIHAEETIWEQDGNPYCIMDDISVCGNCLLTVGAGVTIKFNPLLDDADLATADAGDLLIYGGFNINGTQENPVTITSGATSPVAGDWGSIVFYNGAWVSNTITGANISYPMRALKLNNADMTIRDNSFSNCSLECVLVDEGEVSFTGNSFTGCASGSSSNYCIKTTSSKTSVLKGNTFLSSPYGVSLMGGGDHVREQLRERHWSVPPGEHGSGQSCIERKQLHRLRNGDRLLAGRLGYRRDAQFFQRQYTRLGVQRLRLHNRYELFAAFQD